MWLVSPFYCLSCRMIELDSKSLNSLAGTGTSIASGHSRKSSDASQISLNSGKRLAVYSTMLWLKSTDVIPSKESRPLLCHLITFLVQREILLSSSFPSSSILSFLGSSLFFAPGRCTVSLLKPGRTIRRSFCCVCVCEYK